MVVTLIMLMAVLVLGLAAAQSALQNWKTARNDTDRQIAFQAAEAALRDAEMDIENSPDPARSRSYIFSRRSALGFPAAGEPACNRGAASIYRGLCRRMEGEFPVWQMADFSEDEAVSDSVAYGTFTGQSLQVGKGALPSRLPRYIIELFAYHKPWEPADKPSYIYRVTAVGFGARETTQVALQSFYRKEDE
jgi:type IV pilus assembly protein PilX